MKSGKGQSLRVGLPTENALGRDGQGITGLILGGGKEWAVIGAAIQDRMPFRGGGAMLISL